MWAGCRSPLVLILDDVPLDGDGGAGDTDASVSTCDPPRLLCGGACLAVTSDPANCGACGNACPMGQPCQGGQCVARCSPGFIECNGGCVDPLRDPLHCGGCGHA